MVLIGLSGLFTQCTTNEQAIGSWDYQLYFEEEYAERGTMHIKKEGLLYSGTLTSLEIGTIEIENMAFNGNHMTGEFDMFEVPFYLQGTFSENGFKGTLSVEKEEFPILATRFIPDTLPANRPKVTYLLDESALADYEQDLDHATLVREMNEESFERGARIYNTNCINCHGNPDMEGSIPLSLKFWEQAFKAGKDPFALYQTITKGYGAMPPQVLLTPQEKYDVILYIREEFVKENNAEQYFRVGEEYLASLPSGSTTGPAAKAYHPWSDMDYGNFFMNTYELVDEKTGPERFHSPGPIPFVDEDYSEANFAYKGIAVRLDEGAGGVSAGNTFMMFDHDVMRVAGGWTGEGFIDWRAILLNDEHETYPRIVGELHFETSVGPGWANPETGSFEDPRFKARDGRHFGPLPRGWADYKGLYRHGDHIILSYSVGDANILEEFGMASQREQTIFLRTLNISPSSTGLRHRVAKAGTQIVVNGEGASISEADGFVLVDIPANTPAIFQLLIAKPSVKGVEELAKQLGPPASLDAYTKGGPPLYPEEITSSIVKGKDEGPFLVDQLMPPFENPWNCRMKLSGIDFLEDANKAVACATDGDIWLISGLTSTIDTLRWKRIGTGLFQPLGIKVVKGDIFVVCRDQIVRLRDLNGDDETDFYESFNHDHQVTDHFHEFAMGLQADNEGNLYYAKSGRHAREALIPQHGTLLKVSKDGRTSDIIATGFRAANGVCINPDGSFIVTDQQGYWNPMNRINWVEGNGKFYGNMWGYEPPEDSSRAAMEQPLVWVDMEFDQSPSELVWVDSKKWGPLHGSLLSFSYGFGKIQLVLPERVGNQMQAGVIDLPGIKFMTGVMRGRFNPDDGALYACGMSAWGTSQLMRGGGLYRIQYTGNPLPTPIALKAYQNGIKLTFAHPLNPSQAQNTDNFEVMTWDLKRTREYGSDRYNVETKKISEVNLMKNGTSVFIVLPDLEPVDVMTIQYTITTADGTPLTGKVQNTIHTLAPNI